jgi:hypothetical protein
LTEGKTIDKGLLREFRLCLDRQAETLSATPSTQQKAPGVPFYAKPWQTYDRMEESADRRKR